MWSQVATRAGCILDLQRAAKSQQHPGMSTISRLWAASAQSQPARLYTCRCTRHSCTARSIVASRHDSPPTALSFTSANQLSPAEDYEAKLQQLRRKTLPQLREWVTLNRDYLSWEFMLWLADREEEADGHEQLELSVLCGQVMALREGLDPVSFEELQAEIQAAAAAEEAQAQQPDGDHSAAGPSALTVASRFDGIVRQSAQLALTQQGAVIAEQQMRLLDTDVKEARSQSTVELIGRKELSSGEAAQLPQSASAASRILDFLLTVGNRQERAHMLQDAFTPPEAAAGGREEEVELLHTTPLQLLQAIDLMLSREQQPHQLPAGADPAGQLQPSLLAAVGAMQQERQQHAGTASSAAVIDEEPQRQQEADGAASTASLDKEPSLWSAIGAMQQQQQQHVSDDHQNGAAGEDLSPKAILLELRDDVMDYWEVHGDL